MNRPKEGISRRQTLALALATALASPGSTLARGRRGIAPDLALLERETGGRLGVALLDTRTGVLQGWRLDERFAHCSSFKLSLAALVLQGAERGRWSLEERLRWRREDLLPASPVTSQAVDSGLTFEQLAHAALVTSDNTAANALLRRTGGPAALNAFWAAMGDRVSNVSHYEPELNRVPRGSVQDNTTPRAMAHTVHRMVFGHVLGNEARAKVKSWMAEVETGKRRLRAGLPAGWPAGDKTGTGLNPVSTTYVDLAWAIPPDRAPIIIAGYFEPSRPQEEIDPGSEAVLARVGEICSRWASRA